VRPDDGKSDGDEANPNPARRRATGPRTLAGKAASSMNALRHGAYAEALTMLLEAPEAFQAIKDGLVDTLRPSGHLEESLVDRLASLWWRMGRAKLAANQALWMAAKRNTLPDPLKRDIIMGFGQSLALDEDECRTGGAWNHEGQERLLRHEMTLERAFYRSLHELERIQARRHGQHEVPPLAADLNLSLDVD